MPAAVFCCILLLSELQPIKSNVVLQYLISLSLSLSLSLSPFIGTQLVCACTFIHDALEELITCGDTAILSHNLHAKIETLGRIVHGKITSGFQDQFEVYMYYMYVYAITE